MVRLARACAILVLLAVAPWPAVGAEDELPRVQFEAGVAELRERVDRIAKSMRGVHGSTYLAEAITRPTGQYIAIILRALANDPHSSEVCDSVRRHFLRRLTGARSEAELPQAAVLLMERLFLGREPASAEQASATARRLTSQTSLTVELSWRKCAGWLSDWKAAQ